MQKKTNYQKIKVPNNLLFIIDALIEDQTLGFRTRAEFVNDAIRDNLKRYTPIHTDLVNLLGKELDALGEGADAMQNRVDNIVAGITKTCPECLGAMKDGKCQSCGWTQQQADDINTVDKAIKAIKAQAQQKLEDAKKRVKAIKTKWNDANKKGDQASAELQASLLKKTLEDVDYWQNVVDGKR